MESIELNGRKVLLNIIHHDSGEEPESACINRMISIKLGEKTYHRLASDPCEVSAAVKRLAAHAQVGNLAVPNMLTVIITSFAKEFDLDWPSAVSTLAKMEEGAMLSVPTATPPPTLGAAVLEALTASTDELDTFPARFPMWQRLMVAVLFVGMLAGAVALSGYVLAPFFTDLIDETFAQPLSGSALLYGVLAMLVPLVALRVICSAGPPPKHPSRSQE